MTIDFKDFFLHTRLQTPEYAWVTLAQIPPATQAKYHIDDLVVNGKVLVEINDGIYGLPQSGLLAQLDLIKLLAANGYHMTSTSCLFRHETRDITFSLIVDDFGVKYTKEADVEHLLGVLNTVYKTHVDWSCNHFLGITLDWDYSARTLDTSMPEFVKKALKRYDFNFSQPKAHSPGGWTRPQYGAKQQLVQDDTSPPIHGGLHSSDVYHRILSMVLSCIRLHWPCRSRPTWPRSGSPHSAYHGARPRPHHILCHLSNQQPSYATMHLI
jgi:hypothetical protein